ncbi:MAG: low molecular weight phosphotyrosine protein phosphatase, partial [Nocardioidaceae bacterium]
MTPDRTNRAYRIATVCLGNICRSPMAAVVLTEKITAAGLADQV